PFVSFVDKLPFEQQERTMRLAIFVAVTMLLSLTLTTRARAADKIKLALNWVPEPEFGGIYSAKQSGAFDKHGLDVNIQPAGAGLRELSQDEVPVRQDPARRVRRRHREFPERPELRAAVLRHLRAAGGEEIRRRPTGVSRRRRGLQPVHGRHHHARRRRDKS